MLVSLRAAVLLSLLGSYGLYRLRERFRATLASGLDHLGALLDLEWFYLGMEEGLAAIGRLAVRLYSAIEGSFCLGWILLWTLAVLLYLVER